MVRYDCRFCEENVFDVVDIEHLDTLPRTWTCSGCGRKYIGEFDDSGKLIVYQKGYRQSARVYEETAEHLKEIEPTPGSEETIEPPAPGPEETTGDEESVPDEKPAEEELEPVPGSEDITGTNDEKEPEPGSEEVPGSEGIAEEEPNGS